MTFRRASGIGRSSSPATGTLSRAVSELGIGCLVHGQVHGVVPLISMQTLPPGLDVADDGLAAFMDVDMLDRDLLLALAAVTVEGFEKLA